ncbi:MAG: hypothetical protein ACYC2O_02630 [Microthrixaceae bacterium]
MKRLGAVVLAVVMIAGAVLLRDRLDGATTGERGGESFRLRCSTELAQVCTAIAAARDDVQVSTESAGRTADTLSELPDGERPEFDAWLVDGPWAEIVADNRAFAGLDDAVLGEPSAVLGRSPAVIVTAPGRGADLTEACGGSITWRCVGEQALGSQRVGLPTPERGDGLVVLAEATASFFGTTTYSSGDFQDPAFTGWFAGLTELSTQTALGSQTPLARALAAAGTFSVVGALESQSAVLLRGRQGYTTTYPEPMVTADVVLAPVAGIDSGDALVRLDADLLAEQLAATGWRVQGQPTVDGVDTAVSLPETSNLPSPGVLQTLRDLW